MWLMDGHTYKRQYECGLAKHNIHTHTHNFFPLSSAETCLVFAFSVLYWSKCAIIYLFIYLLDNIKPPTKLSNLF